MGKVITVFFLLTSTITPVLSQESESLDTNETNFVVVEEKTTKETTQEDALEEEEVESTLIINKKSYELEVHSSKRITIDEVSETGELSFTSLDPKIVSVDNAGTMNALSSGKTSIEIRLSLEGQDDLVELVSVEVLKESGVVRFKEAEFFLIRTLYFDVAYKLEGNIKASELIWESSDPSIASVENGRVTGLKLGTAKITASSHDSSASMTVHVTAPLKSLAFNPETIEMFIGEEKSLPGLVYAPYDTTTAKDPVFTVEDDGVVELDGTTLHANKVGETKITASINDVKTELKVLVRPNKNSRDADILTLNIDSQDEEQITFTNPDLSNHDNNYFSVNLPIEETVEYLKDKQSADIFIMLEDSFYYDGMKAMDELIIDQAIMEMFEGKDIRIHLLNKNNVPQIVYEFSEASSHSINLKYSVNELDEKDELFSLVQTQAYQVIFENDLGFPNKTVAKIPALALDSHFKQLHFIYEVRNKELVDTEQELTIDSNDYLNVELESNHYLITLSKVSNVNDSKVIVTLSLVLFTSLISGVLFYYYKTHKKN